MTSIQDSQLGPADPAIAEIPEELRRYCGQVAQAARAASSRVMSLSGDQKNGWLQCCADALLANQSEIIEHNAKDISNAKQFDLTPAQVDRLKLDPPRIAAMSDSLRQVAALPDPVGELLDGNIRPNGIRVSRIRVPLGVIFFVYESRPNVTVDAAGLCMKSGNSVILRGGKEAAASSRFLIELMKRCCPDFEIPQQAIQYVEQPDRLAVNAFLQLDKQIDLAIPRGGPGLIRMVSQQARMPVLKHESGNCHVYLDRAANPELAKQIVIDAKCDRPGVCNACESLLIDQQLDRDLSLEILRSLHEQGVEIRGDSEVCDRFPDALPATEEDWGMEYLDRVISVRIVADVSAAIEHIRHYGSGHTDAIVSNDVQAVSRFEQQVDSAAVMVNVSTRFNDGGELGLGAEIGISTDRVHARGPCGLRELTTYKYICVGDGQTRG